MWGNGLVGPTWHRESTNCRAAHPRTHNPWKRTSQHRQTERSSPLRRRRDGMDCGCGGAAPPDDDDDTFSPVPLAVVPPPTRIRVESCYVFKSRLQEYAQKAGFPTPEYHTLKEGPSHEPFFKSTVVVNNTKYESLPGFFSRKAAEQSAAEVSLMEIVKSIPVSGTNSIPAVQETGLCKNLLQEYAQKMNYAIPSYICTKQAAGVAPFVCTVEIGGIQCIGAAARTKKDAEIKAARTALLAIQGQSEGCADGAAKYIVVPGQRQVKEAEKRPAETPKPLKVKRSGSKRKWNKRKFMKKTDHTVDAEKDGGDVCDSDVSMQAAVSEELGRDTAVMHPGEEDRTGREEQELLRDTTMMQPDKEHRLAMHLHYNEARSVESELSIDTATVQSSKEVAMLQPGDEARMVALQPNGDATYVEKPPSNTAMMHREEMESAMQTSQW